MNKRLKSDLLAMREPSTKELLNLLKKVPYGRQQFTGKVNEILSLYVFLYEALRRLEVLEQGR